MTRNRPLARSLARTIIDIGARSEQDITEAIEGYFHDDAVIRVSADDAAGVLDLADPAEIDEALDRITRIFGEGGVARPELIFRARKTPPGA